MGTEVQSISYEWDMLEKEEIVTAWFKRPSPVDNAYVEQGKLFGYAENLGTLRSPEGSEGSLGELKKKFVLNVDTNTHHSWVGVTYVEPKKDQ